RSRTTRSRPWSGPGRHGCGGGGQPWRPPSASPSRIAGTCLVDAQRPRRIPIPSPQCKLSGSSAGSQGAEVLASRHGSAAARQSSTPVGPGVDVRMPLERVEMDFKFLRLFVLDDETGVPLGTPYLIAGIDCY